MAAIKVSEIRAKFPMYADLNDDQLLSGIRQKFYSDIPMAKFSGMIDYDTQRAALQDEAAKNTEVLGVKVPAAVTAAGKGLSDFGSGIGQLVNAVSRQDVDEANKRDAGLMRQPGAGAGHFVGSAAPGLLAMLAPGGASLTGAAITGGGLGFTAPVGENDSRMLNTGIGALAGAGGVAAARGIAGLYQGGKALLEPFTQGGRERIAGRMIQRFADDPTKVATAQGGRTITGAAPTLAEETGDAGLARLQDALRSVDPQIENRIGQRLSENNAARVDSLRSLAGDSTQRTAAETARKAATQDLYTQATKAAYTVDPVLQDLLQRPIIKAAMARAQTAAENQGRKVSFDVAPNNPYSGMGVPDNTSRQITGQALQDLEMSLDSMPKDPAAGIAGKEAAIVKGLRSKLLSWMEDANPAFKDARTTYAATSKPLNGMDVGEEILRRATSNTSNLSGDPRMQTNALLGLLRDEPGLIARGTGRKGINALSDVFEPDQLNLLRKVASEADRSAAVASAGNGPGSATAQRMAAQNVLKQIVGPTGLPSSWAESALANTVVGKPLNLVYGGVAEPKIQQALAEAVLDPAKARAFIAAAQKQGLKLPDNAITRLLAQTARISPAVAALPQPGQR
jgi:hypothetical protein